MDGKKIEPRWFAVVHKRRKVVAWALDYYPEEEERYRRLYKRWIVGDFATAEEALAAAEEAMKGLKAG